MITIGAEDVYDTITEAAAVGPHLVGRGLRRILITTSKFHTRRAAHIWKHMYAPDLSIRMIAAGDDPYDPESWWRDGRQIRWVLAEYGAWVYYAWQRLQPSSQQSGVGLKSQNPDDNPTSASPLSLTEREGLALLKAEKKVIHRRGDCV